VENLGQSRTSRVAPHKETQMGIENTRDYPDIAIEDPSKSYLAAADK